MAEMTVILRGWQPQRWENHMDFNLLLQYGNQLQTRLEITIDSIFAGGQSQF